MSEEKSKEEIPAEEMVGIEEGQNLEVEEVEEVEDDPPPKVFDENNGFTNSIIPTESSNDTKFSRKVSIKN